MAGLMQAAAGAPPPDADAPGPGQQQGDSAIDMQGGQPASPEEQDLYDNIVGRCLLLMFDEKTRKPRASVVEMLKHGDPANALGQTAAQIFFRVEQEAAKAGVKIPGDVKEAAGAEVFQNMAAIATQAGTGNFVDAKDEDTPPGEGDPFQQAFLIAVNTLQQLEEQGGLQDPEETSRDFDGLMQADKSGQLAQLLGQQGAPAGAPPPQAEGM